MTKVEHILYNYEFTRSNFVDNKTIITSSLDDKSSYVINFCSITSLLSNLGPFDLPTSLLKLS